VPSVGVYCRSRKVDVSTVDVLLLLEKLFGEHPEGDRFWYKNSAIQRWRRFRDQCRGTRAGEVLRWATRRGARWPFQPVNSRHVCWIDLLLVTSRGKV
jgi:hypothetical protein